MKKEEIKTIITYLQKQLDESEKMFREGEESHAYILGYLQGTIKMTIDDLEDKL